MSTTAKDKRRVTTNYIQCEAAELKRQDEKPFLWARLDREQADRLRAAWRSFAAAEGRRWCTLTTTGEDPRRLRITETLSAPQFESSARGEYLRGEIFRVNGRGGSGSCNVDFSALGAQLLATRLEAALRKCRRFVLFRIPHRRHNIIEFVPDVDLEAAESPEHEKLGRVGAALAAETWADEDFSDWEDAGG